MISLARPLVMGILNLTPDSFHDGGRYDNKAKALVRASQMLEEGADILDLGGVSTRPGSEPVSEKAELKRLMPVLEGILLKHPDTLISVDTFRASVASKAATTGAAIINDISGGTMDAGMFETIARLNVPYVLMHMQGTPATMQYKPGYVDVTREVIRWLADRVMQLQQLGVNDIIVDPGFGFGKTIAHNFTLLRELEFFSILGLPLLVGISRKSMIYKSLNINPEKSLPGTIALHYHALLKGASILRVHDVKEAVQTIRMYELLHELH